MKSKTKKPTRTRIQQKNTSAILEAALEVFSSRGFRGSTIDQIASAAGLSKPNLLYYFPSKEAIHIALLDGLMETWLEPLRAIDENGDPLEEILAYAKRKLETSRDYPRESRLFANEILQGAPHIADYIKGDLKDLVDLKAGVIRNWIATGKISDVEPHHLIFSIWAITQHYADFEKQIRLILPENARPYDDAEAYLSKLIRKLLEP